MGVVYFSIIPTFEPSRYYKCWIVCFYNSYIFYFKGKRKKLNEDKESDKRMSCADMSGDRAFRMWKNRSSI